MKFKHILLAVAVPALAFLAACGGESAKPSPSIITALSYQQLNSEGFITIQSDSILKFEFNAQAGSESFSKITVTVSKNGAAAEVIKDTAISGKTITFVSRPLIAGSVGDVIKLTYTFVDANTKTAEQVYNIQVIPATIPLVGFQNQKVWNTLNVNYGNAYDLEKGIEILPSVLDKKAKDLLDMTVTGDAQFSKSWTSGNGGKFAKVASSDWTNATTTTYLYNLWKANGATAVDKVTNIAVNDVFLLKSGQDLPFNLYIIKVTNIQDLTTAGNHNDFIEFSYRKIDN